MRYVAVLSSQPGADVYTPIFNYFDDYLITLGEPTAGNAKKIKSANWNLQTIQKHAKKIIYKENMGENKNLYIDSGGFQIIVGHITKSLIIDYIQSYHFVLKTLHKDIHRIFSLDVNNLSFTKEELIYFNDYSIEESIGLIKKYPDIADKQLFVVQSRNTYIFDAWRELMLKHDVFDHFRLWSIGGLVGLKKDTNADFSHAVPITLWLVAYAKKYNGTINQVHWLGQSSRLAFLSMALIEKIYGIEMTADSSQLIRFAPIEHKMPFMSWDTNKNDFVLANDHDTIEHMFSQHSLGDEHKEIVIKKFRNYTLNNVNFDTTHAEEEFSEEELFQIFEKNIKKMKNRNSFSMDNEDVIELQSQNIYHEIRFANFIADKILEKGIGAWNMDTLKEIHPIMNQGRIAKELSNNLHFFKLFEKVIETQDLELADKIMRGVTQSYSSELSPVTSDILKKLEGTT